MYYSKTLSIKLLRVAFEKISYLVQSLTHCQWWDHTEPKAMLMVRSKTNVKVWQLMPENFSHRCPSLPGHLAAELSPKVSFDHHEKFSHIRQCFCEFSRTSALFLLLVGPTGHQSKCDIVRLCLCSQSPSPTCIVIINDAWVFFEQNGLGDRESRG